MSDRKRVAIARDKVMPQVGSGSSPLEIQVPRITKARVADQLLPSDINALAVAIGTEEAQPISPCALNPQLQSIVGRTREVEFW